ncbi:hypothetical protein SOASR014_00560 [Pectobacterium carotovorum subsp. carotovorum]|nr:hypothetical protein SOASR014_00560 [Pectobacterium carotovorum subsp. carotovorum]GLX42637.1 hypothetical protein Pcaca01_03050 [Pectobacterium carotovorum subsp. carotovorum]
MGNRPSRSAVCAFKAIDSGQPLYNEKMTGTYISFCNPRHYNLSVEDVPANTYISATSWAGTKSAEG